MCTPGGRCVGLEAGIHTAVISSNTVKHCSQQQPLHINCVFNLLACVNLLLEMIFAEDFADFTLKYLENITRPLALTATLDPLAW